MQLTDSFSVPVPIDTVWEAILDVERVAPCMPGAVVDSVDGDDIQGSVKVKLGPIMMRYQGTITMTEKDQVNHHAVMTARAREARGNGAVNATISATLAEVPGGTDVNVVTDMDITGKAAQFGRGVMVDVSKRLMGQFADNLALQLTSGGASDGSGTAEAQEALPASTTTRAQDTSGAAASRQAPTGSASPAGDSLDVFELLKEPVKKMLPALATGLVVGIVLGRLTKRPRPRY